MVSVALLSQVPGSGKASAAVGDDSVGRELRQAAGPSGALGARVRDAMLAVGTLTAVALEDQALGGAAPAFAPLPPPHEPKPETAETEIVAQEPQAVTGDGKVDRLWQAAAPVPDDNATAAPAASAATASQETRPAPATPTPRGSSGPLRETRVAALDGSATSSSAAVLSMAQSGGLSGTAGSGTGAAAFGGTSQAFHAGTPWLATHTRPVLSGDHAAPGGGITTGGPDKVANTTPPVTHGGQTSNGGSGTGGSGTANGGNASGDHSGTGGTSGGGTSGGQTSNGGQTSTGGSGTGGSGTANGGNSSGDHSGAGGTSGGQTSNGGQTSTDGSGTGGSGTGGSGTANGGNASGDHSGTGGTSGGGTSGGGSDPATGGDHSGTGGTPSDPGHGGTTASTLNVEAMTGRVATIQLDLEDGASVRITGHPDHGHVSVNPDNSLALVLTGETSTEDLVFSIEITHANGTVEAQEIEVDVTAAAQAAGWGVGDYYMLATDATDSVVVEHGDVHREVYISGSDKALSAADIAAREGIAVSKVTVDFLIAHPEYGASEGMALDESLGMQLWQKLTAFQETSNWLLFEKGYAYDPGSYRLIPRGADGESELHPLYISSYGSGADPVLKSGGLVIQNSGHNVVMQGVTIDGQLSVLSGGNLLLDDVLFSSDSRVDVQNIEGFTLRNSEILDVVRDIPNNGGATWDPGANRIAGLYVANADGVLIENVFADHVGWADDYDYNLSTASGQPPSKFSHDFYLQMDNLDVTFRDNIVLRAASDGAQVRSGGFVEDNVFIDNNAAFSVGGGGSQAPGNYSLILGNLVTSGAGKNAAAAMGALTYGIANEARLTSLIDNIVAHMADPNNAAEIAAKTITHFPLRNTSATYTDDTIVFNWGTEPDQNATGLDEGTLNDTTIQHLAAILTGKSNATIADLANLLRAQAAGTVAGSVDAQTILAYFRAAFGIETPTTDSGSARFVPNADGDGVRWDNRLNWDTGVLPTEGQDITLGNNLVYYSGTSTIGDLDLGSDSAFIVNNGRLDIEGRLETEDSGASIRIDRAGQLWLDGYADGDLLNLSVAGGRFANTGKFEGSVRLDVSDNGQAILATEGAGFALRAGSQIVLHGADARVGFDGTAGGIAVLRLDARSALGFDAGEDGKIGKIAEFRSGAYDVAAANVQSGVNLGSAQLHLDVTGMAAGSYVLIAADEIIGSFGGLDVVGLGSHRDARVVIDYSKDQVILRLGAEGAGAGGLALLSSGEANDFAASNSALWHALTDSYGAYAEQAAAQGPFVWDWSL